MSPTKRPQLRLEALDDRIVPAVYDMRAFGASTIGDANETLLGGAIVHRIDTGWTGEHGVGNLRTVLTLNNGGNGFEQGYNTNYRPIQAGMQSSSAADETRALRLDRVPVVSVNGTSYYEFTLNVNEPTGGRRISVDELRLYTSDRGNLRNYNATSHTLGGAGASTMAYDLDALDASNTIVVRSKANTNAVGEISVLVPVSNFNVNDEFVYIYSKLSVAGGGAEEWGVRHLLPVTTSGVTLSGHVFVDKYFDANGNGEQDEGEVGNGVYDIGEGVSGVTLVFSGTDYSDNNIFPDGDPLFTTGADGSFSFSGPVAGNYQLGIWGNGGFNTLDAVIGDANNDGILGEDGVDGSYNGPESIINIYLDAGANGVGYGFLMGGGG